ncbi:TPA: hypothetical protein KNT04_002713 [Clostridioides difficile]|nr:hypothetical protein [Clostridioides difficile]
MGLRKVEEKYKQMLMAIKQIVKKHNDKFIHSISTSHKDEHLTEEKLNELENWVRSWKDEE